MISCKIIKRIFGGDYCYAVTLNPDPAKTQQLEKLLAYFKKMGHAFWLIECLSENGFNHFHGMIKIVNIKKNIELTKKAIKEQINKYIGRSVPLVRPHDLDGWYRYINAPNNRFVKEHIQSYSYNTDYIYAEEHSDEEASIDRLGLRNCAAMREGDERDAGQSMVINTSEYD